MRLLTRKLNHIIALLLALLIGCGETDKPQTYVFDAKELETNIKKYTISNEPMDQITCSMTSLLFSKEILNLLKAKRKPTLSDMKKGTPTTIKLYKDKIVWNDLGQDTKINKNNITLNGLKNETIILNLIINENNIHFKFEENQLVCIFPFKRVKELSQL